MLVETVARSFTSIVYKIDSVASVVLYSLASFVSLFSCIVLEKARLIVVKPSVSYANFIKLLALYGTYLYLMSSTIKLVISFFVINRIKLRCIC